MFRQISRTGNFQFQLQLISIFVENYSIYQLNQKFVHKLHDKRKCAEFKNINPYCTKYSIYDALSIFLVLHCIQANTCTLFIGCRCEYFGINPTELQCIIITYYQITYCCILSLHVTLQNTHLYPFNKYFPFKMQILSVVLRCSYQN